MRRSGMQPAYGNMKNSQRWEISRRSNWGDMRQIHGISLSLQALILDDTCRDATGALWAATQPLRCTSSFSNSRLYIWTYACLHISSYVCLYYSFATVLVTISVYFWLMLILYLCCHAKTCVFIHYILISLLSCSNLYLVCQVVIRIMFFYYNIIICDPWFFKNHQSIYIILVV